VEDEIVIETRRVSQFIQAFIGWIFWDPAAERRYEQLGIPPKLGYFGSRAAPLAPAGDEAVVAAFTTIKPPIIRAGLAAVRRATTFETVWDARNDAILESLHNYLNDDQLTGICSIERSLWRAADACPLGGRTFFGAHLRMPRPEEPLLSTWHAANLIREWRADTHMAILVAHGLGPVEASILHSAWMEYPHEWIGNSRGWNADETRDGFASLRAMGLADQSEDAVNERGIALRQQIEDRTDELGTAPWRAIGIEAVRSVSAALAPVAPILLARVDQTAGPLYMPAARKALA